MNGYNGASVVDMNAIDASLFDPWINCDDLDFGTILHQSAPMTAAQIPSVTSSSSPSLQTSVNKTNCTPSIAPGTPTGSHQSTNGSKCQNETNQNHIELYDHGASSNGTSDSNTASVDANTDTDVDPDGCPSVHPLGLNGQTPVSSSKMTNHHSKSYLFNIISNAAASAISYQAQHQTSISNQSLVHNNGHSSDTNGVLIQQQASISSSQCSSSSSESSIESSPVNHSSNQYASSPSSPLPASIQSTPTSNPPFLGSHSQIHDGRKEIKPHPNQMNNRQIVHSQHDQHFHQLQHQSQGNQFCYRQTNAGCCSLDQVNNRRASYQNHMHLLQETELGIGHQLQSPTNEMTVSKNGQTNLLHHSSSPSLTPGQSEFVQAANGQQLRASYDSGNASRVTAGIQSSSNRTSRMSSGLASDESINPINSSCLTSTGSLDEQSSAKHDSGPQEKHQQSGQKVKRFRHLTDYVLAEEEKRLLIKEGYTNFPMSHQTRPLSKSEERILRKIRRKIRNKRSAQCSRQRKKEYVEDLERKYAAVIKENEELKQILYRFRQQYGSQHFDDLNESFPGHFNLRDLFVTSSKAPNTSTLNR